MNKKNKINVNYKLSNSSKIYIKKNLFNNCSKIIKENINKLKIKNILILTDTNLKTKYAYKLKSKLNSLLKTKIYTYSIKPGENQKNYKNKIKIESFMLKHNFKKDSLILVIGGGVLGDLGGFTASTFNRGINYINIPSTLLSQVDSSLGGKTAINNKFGKNLIGTFHPAIVTIIDPKLLTSLPYKKYKCGISEIIKHSLTQNKALFQNIEKNKTKIKNKDINYLEKLIYQNCLIKKNIVEKDYQETNLRSILNFGHTIGHAIEKLNNYKKSHGECIAYGILTEILISSEFKESPINKDIFNKTYKLLKYFELINHKFKKLKAEKIYNQSKKDKKNKSFEYPSYVLIDEIGKMLKINNSYKIEINKKLTIKCINKLKELI